MGATTGEERGSKGGELGDGEKTEEEKRSIPKGNAPLWGSFTKKPLRKIRGGGGGQREKKTIVNRFQIERAQSL